MSETPPRILIVDNDEGMVAAIVTRLEHEGYECVTASSGSQGYIAVTEQHIDLIVSDLNMPMGDGATFAKRVRNESLVPIIFVTGFEREFCNELDGIENVSVIAKPFHPNQLLDTIEIDLTLGSTGMESAYSD